MKLLRHTLIVGLNDKDTKKQIINSKRAIKAIANICGDCTISKAVGQYTHDDGTVVVENSLKVELLFKADNQVVSYAKQIKKELNQESVVLVKDYINSELI